MLGARFSNAAPHAGAGRSGLVSVVGILPVFPLLSRHVPRKGDYGSLSFSPVSQIREKGSGQV